MPDPRKQRGQYAWHATPQSAEKSRRRVSSLATDRPDKLVFGGDMARYAMKAVTPNWC